MKKLLFIMLLLFIPVVALAENEISLDANKVLSNMERSWAQGYEPTISDGKVNICLPLIAPDAHGQLKATLILDDPAVTPFKNQNMFVSYSRNEDMIFPIKFKLRLATDYENGDYPCHIHVEGKDRNGELMFTDMPLLLRIRGGKNGYVEFRPVIDEVKAELNAGETSVLTAKVSNPYPDIEMQDMVLTVKEDGSGNNPEVMCEASELIRLGTLAPGASTLLEIPLKVLPTASINLHSLKFSLTFTALDEKNTWEQSFNLPVKQELRLEQGGVQMASSVIQGDTASLTLPLMNMGRGELRNVIASLTISGILEQQSVLVGTIPAGETKQAKINWTVVKDTEIGDYTGSLHVSAEDEWGNSTEFDIPVALAVEERVIEPETNATATLMRVTSDNRLTYALAGVSAFLLVAFVIQGIVLRKKIRKAEEGRL